MKRYKFSSRVTVQDCPFRMERISIVDSVMECNDTGEWVRWEDVQKLREELEAQIPEKRFERLERMLGLSLEGKCPECAQKTRDYKSPTGCFAPEAWATLREIGIDPANGHKQGCSMAKH